MKSARAILILPEGPYRLRQRAVQGLREDPICLAAVEESLAEPMVVVLHWQTTYTLRLNATGQANLHICRWTYVLRRACAMFDHNPEHSLRTSHFATLPSPGRWTVEVKSKKTWLLMIASRQRKPRPKSLVLDQ